MQTSEVSALSDVTPRSGAGRQAAPSAEPVEVPVEPAAAGHAPEPDPRVDEDSSSATQGETWPTDPGLDPEPGEESPTTRRPGDVATLGDDSGDGLLADARADQAQGVAQALSAGSGRVTPARGPRRLSASGSNLAPAAHEAAAPMRLITAAAPNTITRPWWNGWDISCGKNSLPVSTWTLCEGSRSSAPVGPSSEAIGL